MCHYEVFSTQSFNRLRRHPGLRYDTIIAEDSTDICKQFVIMTTKILHHNHIHEGVRKQYKGVKPIKVWFKIKLTLLNKIKPGVLRLSCTISLIWIPSAVSTCWISPHRFQNSWGEYGSMRFNHEKLVVYCEQAESIWETCSGDPA